MANEKGGKTSGGIGFFGLLTIVFITLKLTKFIDWSWWWVLAPLWGPLAAYGVIILVVALIIGVAEFAGHQKARGR